MVTISPLVRYKAYLARPEALDETPTVFWDDFDPRLQDDQYRLAAIDVYWEHIRAKRWHEGIDGVPTPWEQEQAKQEARTRAYFARMRKESAHT